MRSTREGKNVIGRVLGFALGIFGERVPGRQLEKSVRAIEGRNGTARAGDFK
jgi:hypothetical protein